MLNIILLMKLTNKTFSSENPPKRSVALLSIVSIFYEAFFEFITLFLLLYVQLASPLIKVSSNQYKIMLLVITLGLVAVKILVGFGYTVVGYFIDKRDYPLGRYRTFILFGSTLTAFFFVLLFFINAILSKARTNYKKHDYIIKSTNILFILIYSHWQ